MKHSLLPFELTRREHAPDIREMLRKRIASGLDRTASRQLHLLDFVVNQLRDQPWQIVIDHCHYDEGELRLAVTASDLGRDLDAGDRVQAGFYLCHGNEGCEETFVCTRVYRVACVNGYLLECDQSQSAIILDRSQSWEKEVTSVVERSFSAPGLDLDLARFRATVNQMLMTPYELLCNLVAQDIITDAEQCAIQSEFDNVGDCTMYGLINAVTAVARRLRDDSAWRRSFELERLGGEILRGDHRTQTYDYSPA